MNRENSTAKHSMTLAPTVSVVMAVFNGEKYLREAVDSILAQSFADFEFIVIDDGSKDRSLEILEHYAHSDLRIRLLSRPNRGLTRSLNEGLQLARGDFVARMDCDDISLPSRFEKQVAYLREQQEVCLVGSRVEFIDPEGQPINLKPGMLLTHAEIDAALLRKGWPIVHPSIMVRYDTIMEAGGYSDLYQTNQDHDLFLRLAERDQLANLPDVLLKYRQHFESISLSKSKQQGDTVEAIVREAYKRRGIALSNGALNSRPKPMTRLDHHRTWCWTALAAGNVQTARKHALATFRKTPLSPQSWRMMYCALRGR
jgi:glycosyltransferase involved in cell wall biosynthesis